MKNLTNVEMISVAGGLQITPAIIDEPQCNPFLDVTYNDGSDNKAVIQINLHQDTTTTAGNIDVADSTKQSEAIEAIRTALEAKGFKVDDYFNCQ